jgi:hypothetical protein
MTSNTFDVVVVADFTGLMARRFEIMTLLFLASWLEFGGRSRDLPLHIVCIGDAPESVLSLANECGASVTSHLPMLFGGFANKLRGFEIAGKTDNILLLDADMLILSEINDLANILGDQCISAAATNGPSIVPGHQWPGIYEMLGITQPEKNVIPLNIELDTFQCEPYREQTVFPPYYNGGILYAPWSSDIGKVWLDHLPRISKVAKRKAKISNQPSLATAITLMEQKGFSFQLLPNEYHVRWQHIAAGTVTSRNTRLLHTIGFGRWGSKGRNNTAEEDIEIYLNNTLRLTRNLRSHLDARAQQKHRETCKPQLDDCRRIYQLMMLLYDKYLRQFKI